MILVLETRDIWQVMINNAPAMRDKGFALRNVRAARRGVAAIWPLSEDLGSVCIRVALRVKFTISLLSIGPGVRDGSNCLFLIARRASLPHRSTPRLRGLGRKTGSRLSSFPVNHMGGNMETGMASLLYRVRTYRPSAGDNFVL